MRAGICTRSAVLNAGELARRRVTAKSRVDEAAARGGSGAASSPVVVLGLPDAEDLPVGVADGDLPFFPGAVAGEREGEAVSADPVVFDVADRRDGGGRSRSRGHGHALASDVSCGKGEEGAAAPSSCAGRARRELVPAVDRVHLGEPGTETDVACLEAVQVGGSAEAVLTVVHSASESGTWSGLRGSHEPRWRAPHRRQPVGREKKAASAVSSASSHSSMSKSIIIGSAHQAHDETDVRSS